MTPNPWSTATIRRAKKHNCSRTDNGDPPKKWGACRLFIKLPYFRGLRSSKCGGFMRSITEHTTSTTQFTLGTRNPVPPWHRAEPRTENKNVRACVVFGPLQKAMAVGFGVTNSWMRVQNNPWQRFGMTGPWHPPGRPTSSGTTGALSLPIQARIKSHHAVVAV